MQKKKGFHIPAFIHFTELLAASILSSLAMTNNANLHHFAWHLGLCFLQSLLWPEHGTICNHCFGFLPASCPKTRLKQRIKGFICMGTKATPVTGSWRSENTLFWKRVESISVISQSIVTCGRVLAQPSTMVFFKINFSYFVSFFLI